jgi:protein-S-isoprenylcysteine O-methyltransferase Ste14
LAKALPVFVYSIFFPALLFIIPKFILDPWLQLPLFLTPVARAVLGGCLITFGLILLLWSIKAQRVIGQGTPMPLMATQNLVVQKPYSYCRNPLFLGVINLFFGISILFGSISSLVMVFTFSVIILLFTKLVEEKELEKRFGEFGSISSLVMVFTFSVIILLFTKLVEEKELEKRFGEEYLAYKKTTPFIIPSPSLLRRKNTGEKQ